MGLTRSDPPSDPNFVSGVNEWIDKSLDTLHSMPFIKVDPNHAKPFPSDDEWEDFAALKAQGEVRDKRGNVIKIDKPHTHWSARQRDEFFQAFCQFAKLNPDPIVQRR